MDIELRSKVDLLSENYKEIKKELRTDGDLLNHFEALLYGLTDRYLNVDKIKEIRQYIKGKKAGLGIKGNFEKIFSIMLDNREDYSEVYENTLSVYKFLISKGFNNTNKTIFAALILSKRFKGEELDRRVLKLFKIKDSLNSNDYLSCANLATTNKEIYEIKEEVFTVRKKLKSYKFNYNSNDESFILSLLLDNDDLERRTEMAVNIVKEMEKVFSIVPTKTLPLLGLATLLIEDEKVFITEIKDVYLALKETKGYKFFVSKEFRLILSLGVVINKYAEEVKADLIDININDEINILLALEEQTVFSIACL